jgi:hypothetical protein
MNTTGLSSGVIIAIVIFVLIIIIGLFFAIYSYWGTTTGVVLIILTIFLFFIIAGISIYVFLFRGTIPGFTPTPPGPTPPVPTAVKFGDTIALDNPGLGLGTVTCPTAQSGNYPVVTSPALKNKVWLISAVGNVSGNNLTYGSTFTLRNNVSTFPLMRVTSIQSSSGTFQLVVPTAGDFITFTVNKAPGNTSTSSTVMYGDSVVLTVFLSQPSPAPPIDSILLINTSESPGGSCGNNVELTFPLPSVVPNTAIWQFN